MVGYFDVIVALIFRFKIWLAELSISRASTVLIREPLDTLLYLPKGHHHDFKRMGALRI